MIYTRGYSPDIMGSGAAFREGFNFLQKPFDINSLSRMIALRLRER